MIKVVREYQSKLNGVKYIKANEDKGDLERSRPIETKQMV